MPRVVSTAIVLALLAATAGAFALTERAKLERSPIYGTRIVNPVFSPAATLKPTVTIEFRVLRVSGSMPGSSIAKAARSPTS